MKKIIFGITLIFAGFLLGACSTNTSAEQTDPLKIWKQNTNGNVSTFCLVDEDTGLNYIVVREISSRGSSIAITPRLSSMASNSYYRSK